MTLQMLCVEKAEPVHSYQVSPSFECFSLPDKLLQCKQTQRVKHCTNSFSVHFYHSIDHLPSTHLHSVNSWVQSTAWLLDHQSSCRDFQTVYIYTKKGVHSSHCNVTAPGMVSCWGLINLAHQGLHNCLAQEYHLYIHTSFKTGNTVYYKKFYQYRNTIS